MTVVRLKNNANPYQPFNNLVGDLFKQMPSLSQEGFKHHAPANIKETAEAYVVELMVPGFNKEDLKLQVENNIMTISGEVKKEEDVKYVRKEFRFSSFNRSFTLDKQIDADAISAQYVNGVLTLNLPKKEEVKPATKQINIQ